MTMIPVFLIWDSVGMTGTLTMLWAGNLFGSAFYMFLLRQFFLALPRELFEAAKVDGANNWQIFRLIALPLCKPALVVTASVITTIPMIILFFLGQKHFVEGIATTGSKG